MSLSNTTSTSSIQDASDALNRAIVTYVRYMFPVIFSFGVISNILNIYVFTRPALRQNSCAMYFLSSSAAALIFLLVDVPFRYLQYVFNIDPTSYSLVICKFKYFFSYTWRAMTSWFVVLACFDRYLHSSSNVNIRAWSSFKVASRTIPIAFILVNIAYSHVLVCYKISSSQSCKSESTFYGTFLGIWHLFAYGIGPPLLMFLFSLLTIRHVHRGKRLISTVVPQSNQTRRNSIKDRNLLRMAFVQCLFVGITTTSYAATQLYNTSTANFYKDRLQLAIDFLFTIIFGSISAIGHSTTFFVFTLTSKMFRKHLLCQYHERI